MSNLTDEVKSLIPVDKVYDDLLSPGMKQLGQAIENFIKSGRFILSPIDLAAAHFDKWQRYLKKISDKVDEVNLVEGHPQIVIPALEGLSLQYENSLLSELFINLLAKSIDKTKQDLAHPAFPKILQQISHDEAVILFYLKKGRYKTKRRSEYDESKNMFYGRETVFEELPVKNLQFPDHMNLYMNHLYSLNLAGTYQIGKQEIIRDEQGKQTGVFVNSERLLEEFGELFVKSCVPDQYENL